MDLTISKAFTTISIPHKPDVLLSHPRITGWADPSWWRGSRPRWILRVTSVFIPLRARNRESQPLVMGMTGPADYDKFNNIETDRAGRVRSRLDS